MLFIPVHTEQGIKKVASIADEIWHEYWPALIGDKQTDYMVDKLQSVEAITCDLRERAYLYWILESEGEVVGYTAVHPESDTGKLFVSKIYLFDVQRGKGFASQTIDFYEAFCNANALKSMYLTVNKYNNLAIRAYKGNGFQVVESTEVDIGGGFIMDDYVMEKVL